MHHAACFSLALTLSSLGGNSSHSWKQDLESEARLQQPLNLRIRFATVKDVLDRISKATGVELRTDTRDTAERNVFVFYNGRPVSIILNGLAEVVGGEWRIAKTSGEMAYTLRESPSERARKSRSRASHFSRLLAELEREVLELQKIASLPRSEVLKKTNDLRISQRADDLSPENKKAIEKTFRRLSAASVPNCGPLLHLFTELSEQSTRTMLAGTILRFSTRTRGAFKPLPQSIGLALIQNRPDEIAEWYKRNIDKVEVRADFRIEPRGEDLALICRSQVLGPPHPATSGGTDATVTVVADAPPPAEPPSNRTGPPAAAGEISLTVPAKLPVSDDPSTYVPERLLVDYLDELAKKNPSMCLIGDANWKPVTIPAGLSGTVPAILEQLCSAAAYTMKPHPDGVLVLRSRTAYIDELTSVPATTMRDAMAASISRQRLSLMDHADLASRLTNWQITGLKGSGPRPRIFMWPPIGTQVLWNAREHLRFIATLDSRRREHLLDGIILPFQTLTATQGKAYRQAIESVPGRPDHIEAFTDEEVVRSGVKLIMDKSDPLITRGELVYTLGQPGPPELRVPLSLPTPNKAYIPRPKEADSANKPVD